MIGKLAAATLIGNAVAFVYVQAFVERAFISPGALFAVVSLVLLMWLGGFFLGLSLLAAGLYRARVVPLWTAALVGLWVVGELTLVQSSKFVEVSGFAFLLVGLGYVGLKVLRMSDAQWSGTGPEASEGIESPAEPRRWAERATS